MPLKPSKKWVARALMMLSLTLLVGCATQIPDACAWLAPIAPNPGFDIPAPLSRQPVRTLCRLNASARWCILPCAGIPLRHFPRRRGLPRMRQDAFWVVSAITPAPTP